MNYIYDILLNFNEKLYDFYDWNMADDIKHIRRIPLFKVTSEDLIALKENKVVVDQSILNKIYRKTEIFERRKIVKLDYACLVCDGLEVIGIYFNNDGKSMGKTKLLVDEESEVLDISVHLNEENFDYNILSLDKPEYLKTRQEIQRRKYIINELQKLVNSKDHEKLKYLYYECFNKTEVSEDKMMNTFMTEIEQHFSLLSTKLYDFFKLTSLNK